MSDELIFSYTRKQAIKDGVLIDVSKTAKEAGMRYDTAVTDGIDGSVESLCCCSWHREAHYK